jgi:hypothetical protein
VTLAGDASLTDPEVLPRFRLALGDLFAGIERPQGTALTP